VVASEVKSVVKLDVVFKVELEVVELEVVESVLLVMLVVAGEEELKDEYAVP
jgi:hypothetical protein